jgi:regulator of PEP synthase PpsR (kinase-PPPase family)
MSKILNLYLVSDSSGETVIAVSKAIFVQFTEVEVVEHVFWLVRTKQQVDAIIESFEKNPGIVIYTMGKGEIRNYFLEICHKNSIPHICPLNSVVNFVSKYVEMRPSNTGPGKYKKLDHDYYERINNINYALSHDDGQSSNDYQNADIILLGISRTSKSPTSLYLAQRGYNVANFPIVPNLPFNIPNIEAIIAKKNPVVIGLTILPNYLLRIRNVRLTSLYRKHFNNFSAIAQHYSSVDSIKHEIQYANSVFNSLGIKSIDVTNKAVEEVAAEIINIHSKSLSKTD